MTDMEILQLADSCGVMAVTKHEWDGKQFNHTDDYLDGDAAALVIFARELMKKREWVGLTGEILLCAAQSSLSPDQYDHFEAISEHEPEVYDRLAKAIKSKLKEKNT